MNEELAARLARVKLIVFDIDGVITDGRLYHGPDGQEWRSTSVRDGLGLKSLVRAGIATAVISGRPAGGLDARLDAMGVRYRQYGQDDKLPLYRGLATDLGIASGEAAMMGDDIPDLALFEATGLGLCPADAHPRVRTAADWVSQYRGGQGAVREAADLILESRR